jgi:hypothetical protein
MLNPGIYFVFYHVARNTTNNPLTTPFPARSNFKLMSRFIFFFESTEKDCGLKALTKSNKKALQSVASVLRLEPSDAEETLIRDVLIDFCDETATR